MKRIVIDVSKGALDYIREAVEHKHKSLMDYFDRCEAEANKPIEVQALKDYFGAATVKAEGQPVSYTVNVAKPVRKPRKVAAPYGLKKDGTPKSKPGRKA